ncbi:MAG: hypothetical protein COA33_001670 [Fluviicola sp.]|nr:hypothetical protein [Fluviicola sp.]
MKKETIALIEIGGSHDECLLTQFHALKSANKRIFFITTQEIIDRNPSFSSYINELYVLEKNEQAKDFSTARRIKKLLKKENVAKVVLNTAHGKAARNLSLLCLFSKVKFFGILHTTIKLKGSFTQKIISCKVRNYFLLSQHLYDKAQKINKLCSGWFYPVRFDFDPIDFGSSEKITIVIIGGVENRRKDLLGFVDLLENVHSDVNFIFLGKSDPQNEEVIAFKAKLKEKRLEKKVKLYDTFVSNEIFSKTVQSCDAILPLVHPNTPSAKEYFNRQISGAMTVAFGYKKPMLLHEAYQHIEEMQIASLYYSLSNFSSLVLEKEKMKEREKAMIGAKELQSETQEKRYIEFLER